MPQQPSFSQAEFADKKKATWREKFLARMEALMPWMKLLTVIEPYYPNGERNGGKATMKVVAVLSGDSLKGKLESNWGGGNCTAAEKPSG